MRNNIAGHLTFVFAGLFFSFCGSHSEQGAKLHPIEKYVTQLNGKMDVTQGKKVVFVINTNGCSTCHELIKKLALSSTEPNMKFIYSVEVKGLADLAIVNASKRDSSVFFMDYKHIPFRKGLVGESPTVYFLTDGLMVDSTTLKPDIFDAAVAKSKAFLAN